MLKMRRVDSSAVHSGLSDFKCWCEGLEQKNQKPSSIVIDYLHPSSISDVMEELNAGEYGSVTQHIGHLMSLKNQLTNCDVIDVDDDRGWRSIVPLQVGTGLQVCLAGPLVILDSDDEENVNNGSSNRHREVISSYRLETL